MNGAPFTAIDHVQLAMPAGAEETARAFFRDVLGMAELPKPDALAKRGGCWFQSDGVQIHLGVDSDFRPARRAHPGLRCSDFSGLLRRLRDAGVECIDDADGPRPRAFVFDPFGNRIELIG